MHTIASPIYWSRARLATKVRHKNKTSKLFLGVVCSTFTYIWQTFYAYFFSSMTRKYKTGNSAQKYAYIHILFSRDEVKPTIDAVMPCIPALAAPRFPAACDLSLIHTTSHPIDEQLTEFKVGKKN